MPCVYGDAFSVTRYDSNNWLINASSNLTLYLVRGRVYYFNVDSPGYKFWIKTSRTPGLSDVYTEWVHNNGTERGTIIICITANTPSTLYYIEENNPFMSGVINVIAVPFPSTSSTSTSTSTSTSSTSTTTQIPLNFDVATFCQANDLGTIYQDNVRYGVPPYEFAYNLGAWFTSPDDAANPESVGGEWVSGYTNLMKQNLCNGLYFMAVRDAAGTIVVKAVPLYCTEPSNILSGVSSISLIAPFTLPATNPVTIGLSIPSATGGALVPFTISLAPQTVYPSTLLSSVAVIKAGTTFTIGATLPGMPNSSILSISLNLAPTTTYIATLVSSVLTVSAGTPFTIAALAASLPSGSVIGFTLTLAP
jgi:hypothetical protein